VPTWKVHDFDMFTLKDVVYGNGLFVAVGDGIATSADGLNWTNLNINPNANRIVYGNNQFATMGPNGVSYYSVNGTTWSNASISSTPGYYNDTIFANGYYVTTGTGMAFLYASQSVGWTRIIVNSSYEFFSLAYFNNKFYAGGTSGRCASATTPASTWYLRYVGSTNTVSSLAANNVALLALNALNHKYIHTNDGINWTQIDSPINIQRIVSANNKLFISDNSSIYWSEDGITWEQHTAEISNSLQHVTYGDGRYVGVSGNWNQIYTMVPPI